MSLSSRVLIHRLDVKAPGTEDRPRSLKIAGPETGIGWDGLRAK